MDHPQGPESFRIPSVSVWRILVFLVRDFGFYLVVAAILGAVVGGAVLGLSGFLLGSLLTDAWIEGSSLTLKVIGYVVLTVVTAALTAVGVAQGFLFSVISFVLRQTDMVEKELHQFLEPMTQNLIARIPFGQEGIPVEKFVDVFDPVLDKLYTDARPKRFSIFFAGNALIRFALRLVIRGVRWAVEELFVEELQEEGVTHVNMTQMERFMREQAADLVLDRYTLQLKVVRRLVLIVGVAIFVVALGASGLLWAQPPPSPNVLLIIVDDLRPELGAYGDAVAHTPDIDALAASGFVFTNAFAPVPVCGAARAALLSGRKPTPSRFVRYDSRLDADIPGAPSLPGYFNEHGYHTLANGKVFDVSDDSADAWSEPLWNPEGAWTSSVARTTRHEDLQKAYLDHPAGVMGPAFERLDVDDADYPDGKLADKTVSDLKRLQGADAPFFLAVGFRKPHLPFNVPAKYWALYDRNDFALPATYRTAPGGAPGVAIHNSPELRKQYSGIPPEGLLDEGRALELIHAYHAAVSYTDAQVGKVLDALAALELDDSTIVVLVGDHGWSLGEHTMWTKHNLFDVTLRAPLIVRVPGSDGARIDAVTDFLDVFPTLIALAGLPPLPGLDGVSAVPVLEDPERNIKPAAYSRWIDGDSVRTARYRYTEWRDATGAITARMLYDLSVDPEETINVSEQADYEDVVVELAALLAGWRDH